MTSGVLGGLNGDERRALSVGWLGGMIVCATIVLFNIVTRGHDAPSEGLAAPMIDELASAATVTVALAAPAAVGLWMRRARPRLWAIVGANIVALLAFSAIHIGGFVPLRRLAFQLWLGVTYSFGPLSRELPYEFSKDAIAYTVAVVGFWSALRWMVASDTTPSIPTQPAMLDIRDGARLVRAPIAEVLAIRSAGNYAEVLLSDGRRPLMRTSLSGLESRLAPLGFVRSHRSWLVNAARVTGLRPEGSGDYAVELGGIEAPLSRRFPQALAALRGGG